MSVAITEMTSGTRTCPMSLSEEEIIADTSHGSPMKPTIRMYFTPSSRIRSAWEFPATIRLRILRGTRKHAAE